jgi:hypothetical protein
MNLDTPSIERALRAFEKTRKMLPRLERPIEPAASAPWILAEVSAPAVITTHRWLYTITERAIAAPSGYADVARTGARTGYGLNASEFRNTATVLRTHIPVAELPGSFQIYPLAGVFLWFPFRCADGTLVWITQEPNVIHGTCEEAP